MDKIIVLMSTYNGMKYIDEQIESILHQEGVEVELLIRDDGSSDGTYEHIKDKYSNIQIIKGENIGWKKSFIELVKKADKCDYYAFADQDDVWKKEKLKTGIDIIKKMDKNKPNVYFSNVTITDEKLNIKSLSRKKDIKEKISKNNAIVNTVCMGCTAIFNYKVTEYVKKNKWEYMTHDTLVYWICTFFGNAYYDRNSYILYRQHANNQIGAKYKAFSVSKDRFERLFISKKECFHKNLSVEEFMNVFCEELSEDDMKMLRKIAYYKKSYYNKLKLLFAKDVRMINKKADFYYRWLIIFSKV